MSQSVLKNIFHFKLRWLLAFAIIFVAFVLVFYYYEPQPSPSPSPSVKPETKTMSAVAAENKLSVHGVICLDVDENDNPLAAKTEFGNPDFLICYLLFEGGSGEQAITIRWLRAEQLILELTETIEPGRDVFWTRLKMPDDKAGRWQVQVVSEEGEMLSAIPFTVKG